jgi:cell filamentation protein
VNDDVDPYLIPGTKVLRNRLGISDARRLDRIERRIVADRIAEGAPVGAFDLGRLRAIHRHLFQDIYDWAGELRTVEINKGGHQFQFSALHPDRHVGRSSPPDAIKIPEGLGP